MWSLRGAFIKCLFVTAATNYFLYGEDKRDSEFQELLSYLNLGEIIWLQYLKKTLQTENRFSLTKPIV